MNTITIMLLAGYLTGIWWTIDKIRDPDNVSDEDKDAWDIWYSLGAFMAILIWPVWFAWGFVEGLKELKQGGGDE